MHMIIAGKVYGWVPIYDVEVHLSTGTVMTHQFYKFRQKNGGFQWGSPTSFQIQSVDHVAGWQAKRTRRQFVWGDDASLFTFKD